MLVAILHFHLKFLYCTFTLYPACNLPETCPDPWPSLDSCEHSWESFLKKKKKQINPKICLCLPLTPIQTLPTKQTAIVSVAAAMGRAPSGFHGNARQQPRHLTSIKMSQNANFLVFFFLWTFWDIVVFISWKECQLFGWFCCCFSLWPWEDCVVSKCSVFVISLEALWS